MQSKTSFFNWTHFRKTVCRFWPIWTAYFVIWAFCQPVMIVAERYYFNALRANSHVLDLAVGFGPVSAFFVSILSVMAVWSFLYSARSCHGTACLPLRRENLFFSTAAAGIVPLLVANVLIALLTALAELACGFLNFGIIAQSFAIMTLELLLFYGFATFCAMLTGNIVVLPAVYGVLNFVVIGVEMLLRALMSVFLFGFSDVGILSSSIGEYASPLFALYDRVSMVNVEIRDAVTGGSMYGATGVEGWTLMIVYGVIGLLFLIAALLLFRRRKMETAGDTVAINVLKPVFRWCMGLGAGLCLGCLIFAMFYGAYGYSRAQAGIVVVISMLAGSFIGWFAGEMIIRKSFRVFCRGMRGFAGWAICAAVILVCAASMHFDLLGLERYTPKAENVSSVTVNCAGETVTLREQKNIAALIEAHKGIISNREIYDVERPGAVYGDQTYICGARITYNMGAYRIERDYDLCYAAADTATMRDILALQALFNCEEGIAARKQTTFPFTAGNIEGGSVEVDLPATTIAKLYGYDDDVEECLLQEFGDFTAGECDALDTEERRAALWEILNYRSTNGFAFYSESETMTEQMLKEQAVAYPTAPTVSESVVPERFDPETVDYSKVFFNFGYSFSGKELAELYIECILPDMADGTLGRIWLVADEDYRNTAYAARININAREKDTEDYGYCYDYFYTIPTVNSARTNAWLAEHGVEMYLQGELR